MKHIIPALLLCLLAAAPAAAQPADARAAAAENAARNHQKCSGIGDFYWEIGDARGVIAGGQRGSDFTARTKMPIASASKLVFGAYVLERRAGQPLSQREISLLNMTAGYSKSGSGFFACKPRRTISGCAKASAGDGPFDKDKGKFTYGNAHTMALAVELGLGAYHAAEMAREYRKYLGFDFGFGSLQLAGGLESTPANYAAFLRKILRGDLRIRDHLGTHAVCASKAACPAEVASSPVPRAWKYSLHHWVEAEGSDGAYSSPGLMGFYPWISEDRKYYGLVARNRFSGRAAEESTYCGIEIRKAFLQAEKNR